MAHGAVTARLTLNLGNMPAVLFGLRREMANLLRSAAEDEEPFVARRLSEIAADFEAGAGPEEVRDGAG